MLQVEQARFLVPPFTLKESVFSVEEQQPRQQQAEPPQGGTRSLLADLRYSQQYVAHPCWAEVPSECECILRTDMHSMHSVSHCLSKPGSAKRLDKHIAVPCTVRWSLLD